MPRASKHRAQSDGSTITLTVPSNGTPPATNQSPETEKRDFWEEQAKVPANGWGTEYMIYVYRDDPPGHMSGYLAKLVAPIDREEFAQTYGGHKYRLMLLKNNRMFAATQHQVALPPKAIGSFDPRMLNASTLSLSGGAGQDLAPILAQFTGIIREQIEKANPADKNTTELLMNASKHAMEIIKTQTPNPLDAVRMMFEMQRQQTRPEDETTKLLLAKVIEKAFTPPEGNWTTQLEGVIKIAEALGMRTGGGGGRGPDLGSMFVSKIPDLINGAVSLLDKYRAITENNRRIAELQRAHAPITVPATPAAPAPAPVPQMPAAAPGPPPTFTQFEREPISAAVESIATAPGIPQDGDPALFERMKTKIVQNIFLGMPADRIIDYISIDNPVLMTILCEANEEQLKKFFMDDPILRQAGNYPGFDTLIKEAVEYIRESAQSDTAGPN